MMRRSCFDKPLRCWNTSHSLVWSHTTIRTAYVVGTRKLILHIPINYVILIVYLYKGQVRTKNRSINYTTVSKIRFVFPRKILMLQRSVFSGILLYRTSSSARIGYCNGIFGGLGDMILRFRSPPCICPGPSIYPEYMCPG